MERAAARWPVMERAAARWPVVGRALLLGLLRFYQGVVSPVLPSACKFYPTCSEYAAQAIARYGAAQGGWMAARRLWRCRPFHAGGYDPVE